jgi:hypothetical protein
MGSAETEVPYFAFEEESPMRKFTVSFPPPLKLGNSLDDWKYEDLTRAIGRVYPEIDLAEVLASPKADILLRDLAITSKQLFENPSFALQALSWQFD